MILQERRRLTANPSGDMYKPQKRAYSVGIWGISAVSGPVLGPLIGGFAAQAEDWSWTIWELMWLSGFCLLVILFFLPETSSSNILYRRARRLRKLTGKSNLRTEGEILSEQMTPHDVRIHECGQELDKERRLRHPGGTHRACSTDNFEFPRANGLSLEPLRK